MSKKPAELVKCQACKLRKPDTAVVAPRVAWGAAAKHKRNGGFSTWQRVPWCLDCRRLNTGAYKLAENCS